jgi:hypothetical protein
MNLLLVSMWREVGMSVLKRLCGQVLRSIRLVNAKTLGYYFTGVFKSVVCEILGKVAGKFGKKDSSSTHYLRSLL